MERVILKMTESSNWGGRGWQTRTQGEGRKEAEGTRDKANGNVFLERRGEETFVLERGPQGASNEAMLLV